MYRILIVDHEPTTVRIYVDFLQAKGCSTDFTSNAASTFHMISQNSYDLILMETKLPDISGFDLCSEICSKTDIPVIFLSHFHDDMNQLQGFSAGCSDFISKASSPEVLWARLEARLSVSFSHGEVIHEFPPLTLDLQRQRAFIHEMNLRLTQIEFSLLALLSSRPGTVWSVEELYSEIWGSSGPADPQIVQAHLSRMRRKMEKAYPRHDFIETIWRRGYQFISPAENETN